MSKINTLTIAQTLAFEQANVAQKTAASAIARALKGAEETIVAEAMLASANALAGLPQYRGAVVSVGAKARPQIRDAAGERHAAHQTLNRLWAMVAEAGVAVPGQRESGAGPKKDEKKHVVDHCFDYAFKMLTWAQFRKLGERIIAACDANDKA